ncbi:flavin-containing monooxygenase [Streptomyces boncukensis]|uniref:NAD(P)-binding domain-containing protein n=1 Tax=Streptomyces boncukensis TaxID=2711219 RepID=A0A6G4WZ71_9ACTN|nr:NAD(P)/FAD-dependent oxidoreductase [Streptomyces boncukensis]NGO70162.1 NAD(P)-binding domain-containing protein [Streptomyces boncukensis]
MASAEYAETVVIGAGQQGCGVAAALQELDREALVLERGEIGQAWAHERWDSMVVGSGNRSVRFPGWDYDGDDPGGAMPGPELARHLRRYAEERNLPVREHTTVRRVECRPGATARDDVRFRTHLATGGTVESRNLVAAVGGYAAPRTPGLASGIAPSVRQLHSRYYRNPAALPDGAVLVVGAGISGQQIADELVDAGREVYLSVGRHRAWPRRYRGRDLHEWLFTFPLYEDFVTHDADDGTHPSLLPGLPVCGVRGDLNLGTLAAKGVVLVGSVSAAERETLHLKDNVVPIAEASARSYRYVIDKIDTGIRQRGFVVPEQKPAPAVSMAHISPYADSLDLTRHHITTIIWCTGFGPDYRILPAAVLDDHGAPLQQQGTLGALPGLYYAGLPDGNSLASVAISACVENGRFIARQIHIDHITRSGSPEPVITP